MINEKMKKAGMLTVIIIFIVGAIVCLSYLIWHESKNGNAKHSESIENFSVVDYFLKKGETVDLSCKNQFKDSGITFTQSTYTSADSSVCSVSGNILTAVGMGRTTIDVELYSKPNDTYYYCVGVCANVYVVDENDEDLIEIRTAQDLLNIKNDLSAKYILKDDVDLAGINYAAIGDSSYGVAPSFTGVFINPFKFKIKNLTIRPTCTENHGRCSGGLFGDIEDAYIDGIILENVDIDLLDCNGKHPSYAGGIASTAMKSIIRNCVVKGEIKAIGSSGGIVGGAEGRSSVRNCVSVGSIVSIKEEAGGIVAYGDYIYESVSFADVTGAYAGGILGYSFHGESVCDCTFLGNVDGEKYEGEIIGKITGFEW